MITKDGYKIIAYFGVLFIFFLIASVCSQALTIQIIAALFLLLFIFSLFFFRNPDRAVKENVNQILSPADGTVIKIKLVDEPEFFKGKAMLVSVFMSVFNVHVNRIPIGGKVTYLKYKKGKFLAEGQDVKQGELFGMIKFGSRLDILMPETVKVKVQLKQKVKGGLSIIGEFK